MGSQKISGRFIDVEASGALILEMTDGSRRTLAAGDLVLQD
jgi:biotin-(acetyl-CoA carboxylase) ligase